MEPRIGIVGDFNPGNPTHRATEAALRRLPRPVAFAWVATGDIARDPQALEGYSGLLIAPGSPYRSMDGALAAIRRAREGNIPLLGTCGGFQHIVVEFVRDVLGIDDAEHAETSPSAPRLAITPLVCSLAGQSHPVTLVAGSAAAVIYGGARSSIEPFFCGYGLNPEYLPRIEARGLRVGGVGEDGTVRILELAGHPFFFGTLFVPQARAAEQGTHPLIAAFVAAATS